MLYPIYDRIQRRTQKSANNSNTEKAVLRRHYLRSRLSCITHRTWQATVLFLAGWSSQAAAQMDIDSIRQQLAADLQSAHIGAGYAAIVDFAVSRDISSARFYPDEVEGVRDPKLVSTKIPYRFVFGADGASARPFLQGHFAYQTLEADFELLVDELVRSSWRTYGGSLSGGYEIELNQRMKLLPAISVGYGRIENRADYTGPVGNDFFRPIFSNLLFDWDANALVYGASLGLDYGRQFGNIDLEVLGNLTHHRVESTSASTEFAEFDGHVTAFDLEVNAVRATSLTLGDSPLAVVGLFGMTSVFGPDRDALGFDRFFETGLGLQCDLSARGWKLTSLRIGLKAIYGPDVTGWGLIVGSNF